VACCILARLSLQEKIPHFSCKTKGLRGGTRLIANFAPVARWHLAEFLASATRRRVFQAKPNCWPGLLCQRSAALKTFKVLFTSGGSVQEKEKARLAEIITRVNDLFEGELTEDDRLVYVNNVIRGKLLESVILMQQAANNTKEQFANSPELSNELPNAIMDALAAHNAMSKQALESERVRSGLRDILLGPAQLYEALRSRASAASASTTP